MVSSGMLRRVALLRATRRNILEDTILHSHGRENFKTYMLGLLRSNGIKLYPYENFEKKRILKVINAH
jgi:hypothetical protein